jgi:hypothetical protein
MYSLTLVYGKEAMCVGSVVEWRNRGAIEEVGHRG